MSETREEILARGREALKKSRREIVDVKNITTSNLQDFAKKVIELAVEGYETNELNQYYARSSIGVYTIGLVKYAPEKEVVKLEDKPAVKELMEKVPDAIEQVGAAIPSDVAKGKPGRKPKEVV